MVFWWTGRGYLALFTTVGAVGLFGAAVTLVFGEVVFDRYHWLWAFAYWLAAAATWNVGSNINGRPVNWRRGQRAMGRFIYNAPNRFLSLPMETWAIPLAVLGTGLAVWGLWPGPPPGS